MKKSQWIKMAAALPMVAMAAGVHAQEQEDTIQTDRPDFVESSNVVGKGRFQIETSIAYERDSNSGEKSRALSTPTLLRLGFADDWEFRVESDVRIRQRVRDRESDMTVRSSEFSDYSLGLKWHQTDGDEDNMLPSVGWLLHVDMPGGTGEMVSDKFRPSLRMVAEWELPNGYSFGVMPGVIYDVNDENDRFVGGILGVVLGKSFTDKLRGFVEFGGQEIMRKKDGGSQITFDMGLAYLVTDMVQLDVVYNRGLNKYTPDHMFGLGLSMKF